MTVIRNFLTAPKQTQENSHGGRGNVSLHEVWGASDFRSSVDFVDRVVVPPNSTIGRHRHGNNEEMYIVLEGQGTMTVANVPVAVKKGDMILNPAFGEHELVNDSVSDIDILVIQVGIRDSGE
ncbi:MAG: cupin domain-containing protein [Paracoccaceae bacterium]|nr:cupin domain-containing protein [Paracoccaceae bacterium]